MKSRYLAGASLAVMACGFIATLILPENAAVFLLRGGFEAGLVGGVADWFAVTALFRHPFGIPIPHTSLLLRNKERIVRSLVSAMENELLNKQSIEDKLRSLRLLGLAASRGARALRKRSVRADILAFLQVALNRVPADALVPALQTVLADSILRANVKAAAEASAAKIIEAGFEQKAFDYAVAEAVNWVKKSEVRSMLGRLALSKISEMKASGLAGFAIQAFAGFMSEEKLGGMLQSMLISAGNDLLDPNSVYRERIIREIRVQLFQLAGSDERIGALKQWSVAQLTGSGGERMLREWLEYVRKYASDKLEQEKLRGGRSLFALYRSVVRAAGRDPEWTDRLESRLLEFLIRIVQNNHHRIGRLIQENVERMDDVSLVRLLEDKIGKDLQWIRVNGAICGFVVGLVLSLFTFHLTP